MVRRAAISSFLVLVSVGVRAHDMFLVLPDHSLPLGSRVEVALYNGTFDNSENAIARDRMIDVSVVDGAGQLSHPAAGQWRDEGTAAVLDLETGPAGTYLVGVSTAPNMIELTAEEFDEYLKHDGVLDVLEAREGEGDRTESVRERYSKHVKTVLQVGDTITGSHASRLGYPIEIVPLANPASLVVGDALECLVLADGQPVANQRVYASYEGFQGHGEDGGYREAINTRTDENGLVKLDLSQPGRWYVRLIRMLPVDEEDADYESNWATLTFEID
jgi:uncharacterized GH25 family protein